MAILENRFPILKDPVSGLLVLILILSTVLNAWIFQEWIELPKLITWFIGFGLVLLVLIINKRRTTLEYSSSIFWVSIAIGAIFLLSPVFSLDAINSIVGVYPRYTQSVIFFISWLLFLHVFGVFSKEEKLKFAKLMVFLGTIISLYGIIQNFGIGYYGGVYQGVRIGMPSFLGNPNFSAMFVVATIPLHIWFLMTAESRKLLWFYFVSIGISIVGLILFNSRGAFLGLIFAMLSTLVAAGILKKYKSAVYILAAFAISIALSLAFYSTTRINVPAKEAATSNQTAEVRLIVWDLAFTEIKTSPLFGTGIGNFFIAFRANTNPALTNLEWFDDAHNVMLQIYASAGVPIGTLLLVLMGLVLYWCIKSGLQNKDGLPLVIAISIVTWLIVGSFTPVGLPSWLLLAVLLGNGIGYSPKLKTCSLDSKTRGALLVLGAIFTLIGIMALGSELALTKSGKEHNEKNYSVSEKYSRLSLAFNPFNSNAKLSLIRALSDQEKYSEADSEIIKFYSQHPQSSGVYRSASEYYVEFYQKTKDVQYKEKAEVVIQKMLDNNNNYVEPLTSAISSLIKLGEDEKADALGNRAVVLDSKSYNSWVLLAQAQYNLNNKQGMILSLEKAFEVYPVRSAKFYLDTMKAAENIQEVPFPYKF